MKPFLLAIGAAALAALTGSPLSAAALMTASAGPPVGANTGGPCTVFSPSGSAQDARVDSRIGCIGGTGAAAAIATADFGMVRVEAQATHNLGVRTNNAFVQMGAAASFFDFVTISPIDGEAELGQLVPAMHNLSFDGVLTIDRGVDPFADPRAFFEMRIGIANQFFTHSRSLPGATSGNLPLDPVLVTGTADPGNDFDSLFYGFGTSIPITTPEILVPVGIPYRFSIGMDVGVAAVGQQARAEANFGNSLEVPFGQDFIILPAGYTANAGNWLVNNRRVDLSAPAVPEPGTWAMMIAGFGMIGFALRRRGERKPAVVA